MCGPATNNCWENAVEQFCISQGHSYYGGYQVGFQSRDAYDYGINDWQTQTCGGVDNTCNTVGTCEIMQWVICSP